MDQSEPELPQTQSTGQGTQATIVDSTPEQNPANAPQQDNTDSIPEQNSVNAPEESNPSMSTQSADTMSTIGSISKLGEPFRENARPVSSPSLGPTSEVVVPPPKSTAANENAAEDLQNPPKQTDSPNPFLDAPKEGASHIQHQEDNTTTDVDEPQASPDCQDEYGSPTKAAQRLAKASTPALKPTVRSGRTDSRSILGPNLLFYSLKNREGEHDGHLDKKVEYPYRATDIRIETVTGDHLLVQNLYLPTSDKQLQAEIIRETQANFRHLKDQHPTLQLFYGGDLNHSIDDNTSSERTVRLAINELDNVSGTEDVAKWDRRISKHPTNELATESSSL
ncbi:hypothetical protein ACI3LX_005566 [Candidozyma auris]